MIPRKTLIAALVSAACVTAASAQTKYNICGPYFVITVNGIGTTEAEALENQTAMRLAYGPTYRGHPVTHALAYNRTRGTPTDFRQAVEQILLGYLGANWGKWYDAIMKSVFSAGMSATITKEIATKVDNLFWLLKPSPYQDADLQEIVASINTRLYNLIGVRVVFVPHSQGNAYASLFVPKLVTAKLPLSSIGAFGVAAPTHSIPTGNSYVTSWNDQVIRTVIWAMPSGSVLPPNVTIPIQAVDPIGHDFIRIYLGNVTARGKIIAGITKEFDGLKTTALTKNIDPFYTFSGSASWVNCTAARNFAPYYEPWYPTPYRDSAMCGNAASTYPYRMWFEPIISYTTVGGNGISGISTTRPGQPSEVPSFAHAHVNACVAAAAAAPPATGGSFGGVCGDTRLPPRYIGFTSGDGNETIVTTWKHDYFDHGGTIVARRPTCRN